MVSVAWVVQHWAGQMHATYRVTFIDADIMLVLFVADVEVTAPQSTDASKQLLAQFISDVRESKLMQGKGLQSWMSSAPWVCAVNIVSPCSKRGYQGPAHVNFSYHDVLLQHVLAHCPELAVIGIDFNCREYGSPANATCSE